MDITLDTVTQWLAEERRGREWLAERCGVGVTAVGHWMNKKGDARPIPSEHKITIRALMEEDEAKKKARPLQNLALEFSDADFEDIGRAALAKGELVTVWVKNALNEMAAKDLAEIIGDVETSTKVTPLASSEADQPVPAPGNFKILPKDASEEA